MLFLLITSSPYLPTHLLSDAAWYTRQQIHYKEVSMPDYTVRYAQKDDIPLLKEVDEWPKDEAWQRKIDASEVVVAVAENPTVIAGHLRFSVLWSTVPFLGLIFVAPEHRGKGLSRRLLEFLTAELKEHGYVALLSSSQTDEPEPQRWHVHMGFHTNGIIEHIADDNVGELVYRKML